MTATAEIVSVRLKEEGDALALVLADGSTVLLSAELLWRECPSAQGKVRRMKGLADRAPQGLSIVALNEMGRYAVNVVFSDGHDRGIYPWSYLLSLAQRPRIEDFIITEQAS